MLTATKPAPKRSQSVLTRDGGTLPPAAGSVAEALATAKAVGWPGAFCRTSNDIEREIITLLLWEM